MTPSSMIFFQLESFFSEFFFNLTLCTVTFDHSKLFKGGNHENLLEFRLKIPDGFTCYVFVRRSDLSAAVYQYITQETTRQIRRVLYIPMYLTTVYILGQ